MDDRIFWQNDSSGVNTRPDLLSTIATKVHVYRRNVDRLNSISITLAPMDAADNESTIPCDVLIYCTGWDPVSYLFSFKKASGLGLSVPITEVDPKAQSRWQALETAAESRVLSRFPHLNDPPPYHKFEPTHAPFRLYKAIAPVIDEADHSIVFLGKMVVGNNFRTAEAQALWAVAYLDGKVNVPESEMAKDVAMTVAWNRRRYLNKGQLGSWFYFDVVAYADMLLEQLKLSSHRRKGWFKNLMDPCFADDLKDLGAEYRARYSS
jgi:dimethylaniline monooxygenase (N-oxide forming)